MQSSKKEIKLQDFNTTNTTLIHHFYPNKQGEEQGLEVLNSRTQARRMNEGSRSFQAGKNKGLSISFSLQRNTKEDEEY